MVETRRRFPREQRRAQILEVATRLFGAGGYEATSLAQIAADVGVTKQALYRHFRSKDELFLACAVRAWESMGTAIFAAATRPGPPDVQLWRGIVAYFDFIDDHRDLWRIVYPQGTRDAEVVKELRETQRGAIRMMVGLFSSTAEDEGMDPAVAEMAEPLAWGFVGAATAIASRWLEHPEEPKQLQAIRLMNFAWQGFGDLRRAEFWVPPDAD